MSAEPRTPKRIVSLLASGTETICALGAGERLVGRSHECDHPAWVQRLPAVSRPTFDITGSSREIDERVRERLRSGAPLYEVDEAAIAALTPDLLVTQTHCEVCAVTPSDIAHGRPRLVRRELVALRSGSLDAILDGFLELARALGVPAAGDALALGSRAKLDAVRAATMALPRVSVVCLEWIDPIFAMGNWGPELIAAAGGVDPLGRAGVHSSATPWEAVLRADPEAIVVAPCGFGLERAMAEMPIFVDRPGWSGLRAVRDGRVYVADGNLYFNRSGPSVFDTPGILAEMLHPGVMPPRRKGVAWQRFEGTSRGGPVRAG